MSAVDSPPKTISLPQTGGSQRTTCIALAGQPNTGKTTLFNLLTGLRAKTANFPGTTVEVRLSPFVLDSGTVTLLDLPGVYGLDDGSPDQAAAKAALTGNAAGLPTPDAIVIVLDATRIPHQLPMAGELRAIGLPAVIAVNMIDEAKRKQIAIDFDALSRELGAPVVPISSRRGTGIDALMDRVDAIITGRLDDEEVPESLASCSTCGGCAVTARCRWADSVSDRISPDSDKLHSPTGDLADRLFTNPLTGIPLFLLIMYALFLGVFKIAGYPMDWIDASFGWLGNAVANTLPDGLLSSFIVDGVIGGAGGVIIFLPQILILFFAISLLDDSGYLSRAVVVMDRVLKRVGLPGQAFVPMVSAHACAIPAIMSTRLIDNARDRLRTILILPLLTCSARLPVYAMVAALLFADRPAMGSAVFFGGYLLGGIAAIVMAFVLGKGVVKGKPNALAVELPPYRWPSLKVAFLSTFDRGVVFLKQAGTIILAISIGLWILITFPQMPPEKLVSVASQTDQVRLVEIETALTLETTPAEESEALQGEWDNFYSLYAGEYSFAGRAGKAIEPVFAPLGFDWRMSVGVLSSFAAREVIVSVMSVFAGIGEDGAEDEGSLIASLQAMKRPDGSKLFDTPTSISMLVFFVLAMQCLPTQAVTKRETGTWKWPAIQLGYMTALAYGGAFVAYHITSMIVG